MGSRCRRALYKSMFNYDGSFGHIGLRPTWKGNLCLLIAVAMIVSATIFVCWADPNSSQLSNPSLKHCVFFQACKEGIRRNTANS
jgi:hypothetical protein